MSLPSRTEPGDGDEEAAIVEAYSVAERVRRQLFREGAVGEAAASVMRSQTFLC